MPSPQARRLFGPNSLRYTKKVLAFNPIAHWPLAELGGATAYDASPNGRNGTYTAVTLGYPGIGDGRTAPLFVPASNSKVNVYSAGLASAFNTAEGTYAIWFKVSAASTWTDGTQRTMAIFLADSNNQVRINKSSSNNVVSWLYRAGSVSSGLDQSGNAQLGWTHAAITWSKSADQVKFYLNGAQQGTTQTGLGTWAGAVSSTFATIGAGDNTAGPSSKWDGTLAHMALWNTPLTAAQIGSLATL